MVFNPIEFANRLKEDIAIDYIGKKPKIFKNLINNLETTAGSSFDEKLDEFIRFKGPFIQALSIPKWSKENWQEFASNIKSIYTKNGLYQELTEVFSELGFQRLYTFQEKTIRAILNDIKELLIVASTGRGKTEAWLIPILQYILGIKKGEIEGKKKSVKAILIYPTKALSQDQFKRIIQILIKLNPQLPAYQKITIGIYDGDTPKNGDRNTEKYLSTAFRYFECPILNLEEDKCKTCGQRLINSKKFFNRERRTRYYIRVPNKSCEHKLNLDFIYLTKKDIINNNVDILLTNPDTINYRLFNINADKERETFIIQPKFIVLDEIHVYSGIFGSFTSLILKRIRAMRKCILGEDDDLRVIAASATVQNKSELFSKISGSFNPVIIEEEIEPISTNLNIITQKIPSELINDYLTNDSLIKTVYKINLAEIASKFNDAQFNAKSNEEKLEVIQNILYDYFIKAPSNDNNEIYYQLIRIFYELLKSGPQKIENLKKLVAQYISENLNNQEFNKLFYNLYFIGCVSGIIENRIHLFSWPLDGYYGCICCGRIFNKKVDRCVCGEDFITSIVLCSYCGEKFYESWFCPECNHIFPANVNIEGISSFFEKMKCYGGGFHESGVDCIKVIWKPTFKCNQCGEIIQRKEIPRCKKEKCKNNVLDFFPHEKRYFCSICNESYSSAQIESDFSKCPSCLSSDLINLNLDQDNNHQCSKCGNITDSKLLIKNQCPKCGGIITPYRKIPWVCINCCKKFFINKPPKTCTNPDCNSRSFALNGYFEVLSQYTCEECKKNFIKRDACGKIDHKKQIISSNPIYYKYKVIYQDNSIRDIKKANSKAFFDGKCFHSRKLNTIGKRFDKLYFTPLHTAVTSAAFLLRYFIDIDKTIQFSTVKNELQAQLKDSKLLSFSDSINEMEGLATRFKEPEYELFIDQLVYYNLKLKPKIRLRELQEVSYNNILSFYEVILEIKELDNVKKTFESDFAQLLKVKKRMIRNKVFKDISERFLRYGSPRNFIKEGIANFYIEDFATLDIEEQEMIIKILESFKTPWLSYLSDIYVLEKKCEKLEIELEKIYNESDIEESDKKSQGLKQKIEEYKQKINLENEKTEKILDNLIQKKYIYEEFNHYFINTERIVCFLVDKNNPIRYSPETNDFFSDYSKIDKQTINFTIPAEKRIDIWKDSFFSRNIYRILNYFPIFLRSNVYRGDTKAFYRRTIEYNFKNSAEINYLSTGPAMEIGIDIGDLNMLLLYGTPPNVNSYLQRIGRAGRKAKKSLIFSVSKRNPIDYYYFNNTTELIKSESQPVPLSVLNFEIIKISLTWAILDYIALHYNILWKLNDVGKIIAEGIIQKANIATFLKNKQITFTHLLLTSIKDLITGFKAGFDVMGSLKKIEELITKDSIEIFDYLKLILDFNYCSVCGKIIPKDENIQKCTDNLCNGDVLNLIEIFEREGIFNEIINQFPSHILYYYIQFVNSLNDKIDNLDDKKRELSKKLRAGINEEQTYKEKKDVEKQIYILTTLKNDIENLDFSKFMRNSIMKKYFFNIRNIDDEIEIFEVSRKDDVTRKTLSATRNLTIALSEYHPYAKVKSHMREYFVTKIDEDPLKKAQINEKIIEVLKNRRYCSNCNAISSSITSQECENCGKHLEEFENFVPKCAEIQFQGIPLNFEDTEESVKIFPNDIYPLTSRTTPKVTVNNTYCRSNKLVYNFEPEKGVIIKNKANNEELFEIEFGKIKIIYFTEKFNASYSNGIFDRKTRYFLICGHEDCNSVLDIKNNYKCPRDKNHSRKRRIRLVRDFFSKGIKIYFHNTDDLSLSHTFAHGLKVALQKIAGVDIRSIGESEETLENGIIYIFDEFLGGNGICETLFYLIDGTYKNLKESLKLIKNNFEKCCNFGCPHCLYQFGCFLHNEPNSFNKMDLLQILKIRYEIENKIY